MPHDPMKNPRLKIQYSQKLKALATVRNLVFCFDDAVGPYSTNLRKLAETLENFGKTDDGGKFRQIVYYQPDPTRWDAEDLKELSPPVFVNGIVQPWDPKDVVANAYNTLSQEYRTSDRIFVFGCGRGAFVARAFAAMLKAIDLRLDSGLHFALNTSDFCAWPAFVNARIHGQNVVKVRKLVQNAMKVPPENLTKVTINYLGLWETISPICKGGSPLLPLLSSPHIASYIRHALAISEQENQCYDPFVKPPTNTKRFLKMADGKYHDNREVWFIGTRHDVIGGMQPIQKPQLANIPLRWMLHTAAPPTLYFNSDAIFSSPFLINCVEWTSLSDGARLGARRPVLDQLLEPYQIDGVLYRVLHDAHLQESLHGKGIPDLDISGPLHPTSPLRRPSRLSDGPLGAIYRRIPSALIRLLPRPTYRVVTSCQALHTTFFDVDFSDQVIETIEQDIISDPAANWIGEVES